MMTLLELYERLRELAAEHPDHAAWSRRAALVILDEDPEAADASGNAASREQEEDTLVVPAGDAVVAFELDEATQFVELRDLVGGRTLSKEKPCRRRTS